LLIAWQATSRPGAASLSKGGKLAGLISIGDVVKYRLDELELEANVLRETLMVSH